VTRNRDLALVDLIERLTDPPTGGPVARWGVGVAAAIAILAYSFVWLSRCGHAIRLELPSRYGTATFNDSTGQLPMAFGSALAFVALYLHFRWFWSMTKRLDTYYEPLQMVSLLGVAASVIWSIWRLLMS